VDFLAGADPHLKPIAERQKSWCWPLTVRSCWSRVGAWPLNARPAGCPKAASRPLLVIQRRCHTQARALPCTAVTRSPSCSRNSSARPPGAP
jgi:hypothetical protein